MKVASYKIYAPPTLGGDKMTFLVCYITEILTRRFSSLSLDPLAGIKHITMLFDFRRSLQAAGV